MSCETLFGINCLTFKLIIYIPFKKIVIFLMQEIQSLEEAKELLISQKLKLSNQHGELHDQLEKVS